MAQERREKATKRRITAEPLGESYFAHLDESMRTSARMISVCPFNNCISFILLVTCWFLATHWGVLPFPCFESDVSFAKNLRSIPIHLKSPELIQCFTFYVDRPYEGRDQVR